MKKTILTSLLISYFTSPYAEELVLPANPLPKPVNLQLTPFIYAESSALGYGISFRIQREGNTLELAPMISNNHDNPYSENASIGLTFSYTYAFFEKKLFHPYIGYSFTHWRLIHPHTCGTYHKSSEFLPLIGVEYCNFYDSFSTHFFVDLAGPRFGEIYGNLINNIHPRFGAGFHF